MFRVASRIAALPAVFALCAALMLTGCSRSHPNSYGLNGLRNGADTTGADAESGPVTPGSVREFSARVGDTVYFSTDSTMLSPEAQQTLISQSQWLNRYPQYSITLEGHADERGTREYNIALGARRAASVKEFLASRGVDPRRLRTISYGKERPVAVCPNISCWSQNRRSVTVLNQGGVAANY
jgi:peptidoglycan-associated lipoprotein